MKNIHNHWHTRPNRPFHPGWWVGIQHHHHHHWHPWYGGYRPYSSWFWWNGCSVASLTGWFIDFSWTRPYYFSYGTGGNICYVNNVVYVDGQQYATAAEYYNQAQSIASAVPQYTQKQAAELEWMPLGVWAVTRKDGSDSNMVLQLAVNKDGIIAGTYYNETTKTTIDLEGSVDKETQRVAWHPVDGKNDHIVFETGLFNLTEDSTTALVHFGADRTQEVILVRLDQPQDQPAPEVQGVPGDF